MRALADVGDVALNLRGQRLDVARIVMIIVNEADLRQRPSALERAISAVHHGSGGR